MTSSPVDVRAMWLANKTPAHVLLKAAHRTAFSIR